MMTNIRARLLLGMVSLAGLALLIAGAVDYALARKDVQERIDSHLTRVVEEFRLLVSSGVDPQTGTPYAESQDVLYTAMQHTLPTQWQGMAGLVDGQLRWNAPHAVHLRLEEDPEFMAWAGETADQVRISTVTTQQRTYRAITVPVRFEQDPTTATFVLAHDYSEEMARLNTHTATLAMIGGGVMVVAGAVAWLIVGRMLLPVRRLHETTQMISEEQLDTRIEVTGHDEFADLTITINQMLDRLQNAVESQRQLLDDVGHELRTPVTIIRGHLELMDVTDQQDVQQTKDISLDELERMSLLINDLVTLATANRPDFVKLEQVPVGPLLDDILDKARGLGTREWRIGQRVEANVELDPARITQAVLQLCANAVKFSEEGSRIDLGVGLNRNILRLWVRDNGEGIPEDELERIFERFGRGKHDKPGSGLGLNIVSAIANAHGGVMWVQSVPGGGSTFYIDIPLVGEYANSDH